jgi:ABC-2 type transport system permease protein
VKVLRWELFKLRAQPRFRAALLVCLLGPPLFAAVLSAQSGTPKDTLFGRHVHDSGLAFPLLLLGFASTWALPLLTSLVAGDIFASEDGHGTWPAMLTRSRTRAEVFLGKAMASALVATGLLVVTAASSLVAGLALAGDRPLIDLSGTVLTPSHALLLVLASWTSALPPLLGFTALAWLFSVLTRSSLAGVGGPVLVGLLLQLLSLLGPVGRVSNAFLTAPFFAWHGLVRSDPYYGPLWQGLLVSLAWGVPCAVVARLVLLRRDLT